MKVPARMPRKNEIMRGNMNLLMGKNINLFCW